MGITQDRISVRIRGRHLLLIDLLAMSMAVIAAFVIRYEALWRIGPYLRRNLYFFAAVLIVRPPVYYFFGLYRRWWRYASISEMLVLVEAVTLGSLIIAALTAFLLSPVVNGVHVFSRSVLLIEWMLSLLAVGSTRMLLRLIQTKPGTQESRSRQKAPTRRALIMGAGDAGVLIVREMQTNPSLGYLPIGFVDDAPEKQGVKIRGVPVLGTRQDIPHLSRQKEIDEVIIAMPTAPGSAVREIRALCEKADIPAKTIPGLYELLSGAVSIGQIREVKIEDLLRREPVQTDLTAIEGYIAGEVVLVTGAGGSIGSELCRQIALRKPRQLLLLGHGENSIYHIWKELLERFPKAMLKPLIADIRDADRLERLLLRYRPAVVFHAAAHKHVPLMESNAEEAFTNNVLGTANLLNAADKADTDRFVLISSDKAVNPVNIMGASKHLAEILVHHAARRTSRRFVVVRFGNVLGSRGSVIPLFEKQIAAGGPVTVTHPDMVRYFMTIPEAVQLVLYAAILGEGGETFVLDMGEQIRILDLARDLISLSGLRPEKDIDIVFTGIRPGEKLYEELFGAGEEPIPTPHPKILQTHAQSSPSQERLQAGIAQMLIAARAGDADALNAEIQRLVPSFRPAAELFVAGEPMPLATRAEMTSKAVKRAPTPAGQSTM